MCYRPIDLKLFLVGHPTLPRKQQHVDGLMHYRGVIDGRKLLADSLGNGVQSCAGGGGEDVHNYQLTCNKDKLNKLLYRQLSLSKICRGRSIVGNIF